MKIVFIIFSFFTSTLLCCQTRQSTFFDVQKELAKETVEFGKMLDEKFGKIDYKDTAAFRVSLQKRMEAYKEFNLQKNKTILQLVNTTYPDFYFEDFEGKSYSLSDFNNQKIILNFNYTFCDWCIKQIDSIIQKTGNKAKIIVLLHDKKSDADHIFEKYGHQVLLGFISLEYEKYYTLDSRTPCTFVLDENRSIRFFDDQLHSGLIKQLESLNAQ